MALPHCPAVTFTQVNDKVCQAIKVAYRQEGWLNLQAGNQFILRVFQPGPLVFLPLLTGEQGRFYSSWRPLKNNY